MHLVNNERLKLTATWLNTLAAGTIIAGAVTPLVALIYGLRADSASLAPWYVMVVTAAWLVAGIALHWVARKILGRLKE